MIKAIHKGIEIEMTLSQLADESWTGAFILDPKEKREPFSPSVTSFKTSELAKETGLSEARAYIEKNY